MTIKPRALTFNRLSTALILLVLSSCKLSSSSGLRGRDSSSISTGSVSVAVTQGRILADNPIILANNANLSESYDLNKLMSTATITSGSFLQGGAGCDGLTYCFEVRDTKDAASSLQTSDGKWSFNATSKQFLQVNTFYHLNNVSTMFFNNLDTSFNLAYFNSTPYYDTALPLGLRNGTSKYKLNGSTLLAYSDCDSENNAYFSRSPLSLCFGYIKGHSSVRWAQDSSAIYHEAGHFFQKLQLNFRNYGIVSKADMGNGSAYDEAGSIGEGLSDFYSFYVNGRTHFAEWGAGRFLSASRPITEADSLHAPGISTEDDQRLSYPEYLNYNPNKPETPVEDIHYSGMIISHYLVALTTDLQDKCSMTKRAASDYVLHLVNETLAELGDLTSKGTEKNVLGSTKVNLNSTKSLDWFNTANPLNYRSFTQTFAKNLLNNLGSSALNRCNGSTYPKDRIETLLDQYGLLLFRTYNENRNFSVPGSVTNTTVTATNRKKSVLISKELLIFDPTVNASQAFVIDSRSQIKAGIASLTAAGLIGGLSGQTSADLAFNNNNSKVSPGEVVAIALNLYNNSNSTMGGIQILANDWNHADTTGKPFQFNTVMSTDQWPLVSEGGVIGKKANGVDPCPATGGDPCPVIGATAATDFAPVCFIQSNESSATKWISQKDYKTKLALDSSLCLNPNDSKDCFIRAIKGADQAHYSKINPKSTWTQTLADPTTGKATLNFENVLLFEVSKQIPPGTVIDCRLRVRFTNCEDCYHDSTRSNYDYTDTDYNGPRPFKIMHLQIPIND